MKVGVYRVYFHQITKKSVNGVLVEVSHTSPEMEMVAAENVDQLLDALPRPISKPGFIVENHITQVDQKHRNVLLAPMKG